MCLTAWLCCGGYYCCYCFKLHKRFAQRVPSPRITDLPDSSLKTLPSMTKSSVDTSQQSDSCNTVSDTGKMAKFLAFNRLSRSKRSEPVGADSGSAVGSAVPVNAISQSTSTSEGGRRPLTVTRMNREETASKMYGAQASDQTFNNIRSKTVVAQKVGKKAVADSAKAISPADSESMFSDTINEP